VVVVTNVGRVGDDVTALGVIGIAAAGVVGDDGVAVGGEVLEATAAVAIATAPTMVFMTRLTMFVE
jgi:hypothetical protein